MTQEDKAIHDHIKRTQSEAKHGGPDPVVLAEKRVKSEEEDDSKSDGVKETRAYSSKKGV